MLHRYIDSTGAGYSSALIVDPLSPHALILPTETSYYEGLATFEEFSFAARVDAKDLFNPVVFGAIRPGHDRDSFTQVHGDIGKAAQLMVPMLENSPFLNNPSVHEIIKTYEPFPILGVTNGMYVYSHIFFVRKNCANEVRRRVIKPRTRKHYLELFRSKESACLIR